MQDPRAQVFLRLRPPRWLTRQFGDINTDSPSYLAGWMCSKLSDAGLVRTEADARILLAAALMELYLLRAISPLQRLKFRLSKKWRRTLILDAAGGILNVGHFTREEILAALKWHLEARGLPPFEPPPAVSRLTPAAPS